MRILAIDTTAKTATAAISENGRLRALYTLNGTRTHSENMLPMIENLLLAAELTIDAIDAFACSAGPGSFTGVRIGVSLIKGLAFGSEKPCISVSAPEALAYNLIGSGSSETVFCPVMDARREQVYTALFRYSNREMMRLCPDRAISAVELLADIKAKGYKDVIFCGDGSYLFREYFKEGLRCTPEKDLWQNGFSVALAAEKMLERNETLDDGELSPIYLRSSQAERVKKESEEQNHGKSTGDRV